MKGNKQNEDLAGNRHQHLDRRTWPRSESTATMSNMPLPAFVHDLDGDAMERDLLSIIDDSGDDKDPRTPRPTEGGRRVDGGAGPAADGDPVGDPLDSKSDADASRLPLTPLSRHPRDTSAPIKAVSTSSWRRLGVTGTPAPPVDERVAIPAGALLVPQGASTKTATTAATATTATSTFTNNTSSFKFKAPGPAEASKGVGCCEGEGEDGSTAWRSDAHHPSLSPPLRTTPALTGGVKTETSIPTRTTSTTTQAPPPPPPPVAHNTASGDDAMALSFFTAAIDGITADSASALQATLGAHTLDHLRLIDDAMVDQAAASTGLGLIQAKMLKQALKQQRGGGRECDTPLGGGFGFKPAGGGFAFNTIGAARDGKFGGGKGIFGAKTADGGVGSEENGGAALPVLTKEAVDTSGSVQFAPQQVNERQVHHHFQSISANPAYASKSHEELRWEDVGQTVNGGAAMAIGVGAANTNPFGAKSTGTRGQDTGGQHHSRYAQDSTESESKRDRTSSRGAGGGAPTTTIGSETVTLSVGGKLFTTTRSTLLQIPETYFQGRLNFIDSRRESSSSSSRVGGTSDTRSCGGGDIDGMPLETIFIDRSPEHFGTILEFMRTGHVAIPCDPHELAWLLIECEFYCIAPLVALLRGGDRVPYRDALSEEDGAALDAENALRLRFCEERGERIKRHRIQVRDMSDLGPLQSLFAIQEDGGNDEKDDEKDDDGDAVHSAIPAIRGLCSDPDAEMFRLHHQVPPYCMLHFKGAASPWDAVGPGGEPQTAPRPKHKQIVSSLQAFRRNFNRTSSNE